MTHEPRDRLYNAVTVIQFKVKVGAKVKVEVKVDHATNCIKHMLEIPTME